MTQKTLIKFSEESTLMDKETMLSWLLGNLSSKGYSRLQRKSEGPKTFTVYLLTLSL